MNILFLGPWLPPARHSADTTRAFHLAKHLAATHRLTLACATDNSNPSGAVSALRSHFDDLEFSVIPTPWKRIWGVARLLTGSSAELAYFDSAALRMRLKDRLRSSVSDLVYVSSSSMIPYALDIDRSVPLIVDFADVDSEWWLQQSLRHFGLRARFCRIEALRLRQVELAAARRAARSLVASRSAAGVLASFAPWAPVTIVPNGVEENQHPSTPSSEATPLIVIDTGLDTDTRVAVSPEFVRRVVSAVRARVPNTRFVLAGQNASRLVKQLARDRGVEVVVSDSPAPLRQATVAAFSVSNRRRPQLALLQAMAAGVPVVATSLAVDGLAVRPGLDLHVENEPLAFAQRLTELLGSRTIRSDMSARGRAFVQAHHSWQAATTRLTEVVEAVTKGARSVITSPPARSVQGLG